jgi:undecaprenyl-diphosphatase
MNSFDQSILLGLNAYAGQSRVFDSVMAFFSVADIAKGGVFCVVIWWLWFARQTRTEQKRDMLIAMMCAVPAIAIARSIALLATFRPRPFAQPELHFVVPYAVEPESLLDWSAFPSDHAAMFMAIAVGLIFVNRRIGWFLVAYALLVILLPRIYVGAHHPTDILAGAAIGIVAAFVGRLGLVKRIGDWAMTLETRYPSFFYTGLFLLTWQLASLFTPLREVGHFLKTLVHA